MPCRRTRATGKWALCTVTRMAEATRSALRPDGAGGARRLGRRRTLPGGRAVVGGFLVALAAVGVFAGYTSATADTRHPFLVARRDLPLGHRVVASDLAALPMDLPARLRGRVYRDAAALVGAVVIGPVAAGELVQSSAVVRATGDGPGERQISFPIESARAVGGGLRRGEFVDVLATYGTGADGFTTAVVRGARVADRSQARGSLSDGGTEVITLVLPRPDDALAVAHAVSSGTVMLVRGGPPPTDALEPDPPRYRPEPVPAG